MKELYPGNEEGERVNKVTCVKVSALIDNTTHYEGPIFAENGISLFIEIELGDIVTRVLMDTGMSQDLILKNSKEMGVNLGQTDVIIISHSHYDHTGGLLKTLTEIRRRVPVIMHPDVFKPKYAILPSLGIHNLTYAGIPFLREEVEDKGGALVLSKEPVPITENVMTTGEIARVTEFEKVDGFYVVENGTFRKDDLLDDQALVIKMADDSLVVFTGCSHSGIINTVRHALRLTDAKSVRAIIGGFHLIDATNDRIERTVQELEKIAPSVIAPMHCTGFKAAIKIAEALPEAFKEFYCGDYMEIK